MPGRALLSSLRNWRWKLGRPALAIAGLAAVAACSTTAGGPAATTPTGKLFARGLDEIADLYIEPVSSQKLVTAGAAHLSKLDPAVRANLGSDVRDRNQLTLTYQGQPIGTYQVPDDIGGDAGGEALVQVIGAAKKASPQLAALSSDAVEKAVFDGITGALDRYSRYAPPDLARDQRAARDGFGGIGITLDSSNEDFRIAAVTAGGPASHAGLQAGDRIVAIDGKPTAGRSPADVIQQLRGPPGSSVALTIARAGTPATRDYRVERALVVAPTVTVARDGTIAVFRIASFNHSTTQRLSEALAQARQDAGGRLSGVVLDLRGNPGGLLDQAVSLADLFIPSGPIIATVGRHPASHQYFAATGRSVAATMPVAVLINGASASASEIVAAALQDVRRAVVIGSSSYGKGTVQTVLRLPNDGELTLTWARLVTPSGYMLQEHGVVPTVCTSDLKDDDRALDAALSQLQGAAGGTRSRAALDEPAWSALRKSCPATTATPALDLKVAERVLSDPARYSQMIAASSAAVAQR